MCEEKVNWSLLWQSQPLPKFNSSQGEGIENKQEQTSPVPLLLLNSQQKKELCDQIFGFSLTDTKQMILPVTDILWFCCADAG